MARRADIFERRGATITRALVVFALLFAILGGVYGWARSKPIASKVAPANPVVAAVASTTFSYVLLLFWALQLGVPLTQPLAIIAAILTLPFGYAIVAGCVAGGLSMGILFEFLRAVFRMR